ncbi:serine/arginine repetitive matrix protein 2 [Monomorium pharaonis]|uniref:serine/arginine repetitive matrix protein 2 n=1 Tax=Monomorium pharaonis TaxID=307658 RepID=UPI001745FE70|nr:serine/arginine repetitive matrix protein 2 [Monomorium pharaonis]
MSGPTEFVFEYPLPPEWNDRARCPRCWAAREAGSHKESVTGDFCDMAHLAKHLKKKHPGDTIIYKCAFCNFRGTSKYPLKDVKLHIEKRHKSPAANAPCPSTRDNDRRSGESSGTGVRTRATGACAGPSGAARGVRNTAPRDLRQPGLPFVPTPPPQTSRAATRTSATPPPVATESPSYAAVTAGSTRPRTTPPTTIGTRRSTAAKSAAPIATTSARTAATTTSTRCTVLSNERVSMPINRKTAAQPSTSRAGANSNKINTRPASAAVSPPIAARSARAPSQPPQRKTSAAGAGGAPTTIRRSGEGAPRKSPLERPIASRTRRAASVPIEKSEPKRSAARPGRVPPHPPAEETSIHSSDGEGTPRNIGGAGATRKSTRKLPDRIPPSTSQGGAMTRTRSRAASVPVENSALESRRAALDRTSSRAMGSATSRSTGVSTRRTPAKQPPVRPPSLSPNTSDRPTGGPSESIPSLSPATSLPTTLTTCTVTTTTCGSPVMSTGLPAGGRQMSPRLPPLPTIVEASPCAAVMVRTPPKQRPSAPPRRESPEERKSAAPPTTPGNEGDEEEAWRVCLGRRAGRRRLPPTPPSDSESPLAARARTPPSASPKASANSRENSSHRESLNLSDLNNNEITATSTQIVSPPTTEAESCRRTSPDHEEADNRERTAQVGAVHPNAPVNVRGVMGRRRAAVPPSVPPREEGGAPPAPVCRHGGRGRHDGRRRVNVPAGQPPRDHPAPATVARQRRRERVAARDALVGRAEAVATIADLETVAVSVAAFFGEEAAERTGRAAPGAQDRPTRSRNAGARRGARGGESLRREGADSAGPAPARPAASGEARGDWVCEAKRIQALYRANRRKAVREVLQGPAESCQVPIRRVQEYFEQLYSGHRENLAGAGVREANHTDPSGMAGEFSYLLNPFTQREVDRRLRRMNNSAPGPDGVSYRDLRGADPGAGLLSAVFNACLRLEAVPASWKTSNTLLIHKKGDQNVLENWRPLALGDTVPKLFAALLADRLADWSIDHGRLSPAQKGFLRDEGCYEHNFVLQEVLNDARRTRRQAVVAWLDLSNAFGSIPHETIRHALTGAGVPRGLIAIWDSMYDGCTTRVRAADGFTAPIRIRSGVKQGCPLSPIVFNIAIDSVLRATTEFDDGYRLHGHRWSTLAYADDIALLSSTPEGMRRLLNAVEREAASVGLRFNPAKCATLHIGAGNGGRVLPTSFRIQGQPMRPLLEGESYEHLGVPTGFSVDQTPYATVGDIVSDLQAVDRSLLAPWQKFDVMATFILPRLDFLLRGARVLKRPLTAVDKTIRRYAKSWMNLPQRAGAEGVYMPP